MNPSLGIIGVGKMGSGMWRNLQGKGHTAAVYDVSREAMAFLEDLGAPTATSPRDMASKVGTMILSVPTSKHVAQAVLGEEGVVEGTREGACIIDTTSGEPNMTREIAAAAAKRGVRMIDVGVTGGARGAESGALRLMVGGDDADVDACMPVLELLGATVFRCGGSGSGHTMKSLLNLRNQAQLLITGETLVLGAKAGLDPVQVAEVLGNAGVFTEFVMNPKGRRPIDFKLWLGCKDSDIAMGIAQQLGVPMLGCGASSQAMRAILRDAGPEADTLEFVDVLERWNDVQLPNHRG